MNILITPKDKAINAVVAAAGQIRAGQVERAFKVLESAGWKRPDGCNTYQLPQSQKN